MRSVLEAIEASATLFHGAQRAVIYPLLIAFAGVLALVGARAEDAPPPIRAEASAFSDQGYGRLVLTFAEETKANVQVANGVMVVTFGRPVEVAVDKLRERLSGYVQAARRDPDNNAIRLSLARKVTINVMEAGDKLFIDLLPDGWVGLPPGLPQEVVDSLATRAREAERRERMNQDLPRKVWAPVRLRYADSANFARFAFEMPEPIVTATTREGQELRISFAAPVKVDFGEAKAKLPASVAGLEEQYENEETIVKIVLAPEAGVRTFRDDTMFTVDVTPPPPQGAKPPLTEGWRDEAPATEMAEAPKAAPPADEPMAVEPPAVEVVAPKAEQEKEVKTDAPETAPMVTPEPMPAATEVAPAMPKETEPAPAKESAMSVPVIPSPDEPVPATLTRTAGTNSITFTFGEPMAGALFRRGETVYLVFDTARPINTGELASTAPRLLRGIEQVELPQGRLIKLKLDKGRLTSLDFDGTSWIVHIGDMMNTPSRPLPVRRVFAAENRPGLFVPLGSPGRVHTIADPDSGESLIVVTAEPPARGLARGQDFVDFRALATAQGLAIAPKTDDLTIELAVEGVTITRPAGLVVSEMSTALPPLPEAKKRLTRALTPLDPEIWKAERDSAFYDREVDLARAVAETPTSRRIEQRIALARFYLANDFPSDAIGTLNAASVEEMQSGDEAAYALLHGLAQLHIGRPEEALRDFTKPVLAPVPEAALLRASAMARMLRFPEAREQFGAGQVGLTGMPVELQRESLLDGLRAAIEVADFAEASRIRNDFETIGIAPENEAMLAMLSARLAQGIGKGDQAASEFADVALNDNGPAAAEARLRLIEMRYSRGDLDRSKAIEALEVLSYAWRGNTTELETLHFLGRLYVLESRYREAFRQLDAALLSYPGNEVTRTFQGEMAQVFEDLFLSDKGASIAPIDALAIYYDFSKLTPIGRRGDELIRRLADRLVGVDLLDQASELLDHQVEFRLSGAAKAQVATKLAMIHLMNRKPAEAIKTLTNSRSRELPQELREQRLLLEARAIAETGRHEAALEMIGNLSGEEVARMRADILWSAKRWREAGEAIEKNLGDRWKRDTAFDEIERGDVLRAGIAYTLGAETIGLARLRERFAAKMEGPERKAFDIIASNQRDAKAVGEVAKTLSIVDSLDVFIKLYRARFPDKPLPEPAPTAAAQTPKLSAR